MAMGFGVLGKAHRELDSIASQDRKQSSTRRGLPTEMGVGASLSNANTACQIAAPAPGFRGGGAVSSRSTSSSRVLVIAVSIALLTFVIRRVFLHRSRHLGPSRPARRRPHARAPSHPGPCR